MNLHDYSSRNKYNIFKWRMKVVFVYVMLPWLSPDSTRWPLCLGCVTRLEIQVVNRTQRPGSILRPVWLCDLGQVLHSLCLIFLFCKMWMIRTCLPGGLPRWLSGKEPTFQGRRPGFNPWVRENSWRRTWPPTPVFLPEKSHGQGSLTGHSPQGPQELDRLSDRAPGGS